MRFLHFATTDFGGAGIAALNLHDGLRKSGHKSRMLVLYRKSLDKDVSCYKFEIGFAVKRLFEKLRLKLKSNSDYCFQNQLITVGLDAKMLSNINTYAPDVIVIHSISHFLAPNDILKISHQTGAVVLWYLLDMGHLTGGCHYSWSCEGFFDGCALCPALSSHTDKILPVNTLRIKRLSFSHIKGIVVAGSSLLARQAVSSSLFSTRKISKILIGVNPQLFFPRDVAAARKDIGLTNASNVILFGAQNFYDRRKGMRILFDALLKLADRWPTDRPLPHLLSVGKALDFSPLISRGFHVVNLGYVSQEQLSKAYSSADLFVCPSIEDSGPMMINESIMSGTPVVSFRMGVAEDLIIENVTGSIVELGDIDGFVKAMVRTLTWDRLHRSYSKQECRRIALEKCSVTSQVGSFIQIATELVKGQAA